MNKTGYGQVVMTCLQFMTLAWMVAIFLIGITLCFVNMLPISILLKRGWCSSFLLENPLETSLCLEAIIYFLRRYSQIRKRIRNSDDPAGRNDGSH